VLVLCLDESLASHYQGIADSFREAGISCEVCLEQQRLSRQFASAEKKGVPLAVICGPEEHQAGTVNLKDLTTRESRDGLALASAVEEATRVLAHRRRQE
jgi:histidyl-tRNA synthetase